MKSVVSIHATYKKMSFGELERWVKLDYRSVSRLLNENGVSEHAILRTCNRIEIYATTQSPSLFKSALNSIASKIQSTNAYYLSDADSIRHLMKVCSGMESMVIGEQEIQRQVKDSLTEAQKSGNVGKMLNYVFMKVLSTGKDIRSNTSIAKGVVSLPQAACKILFGDTTVKNVCIVGTGNMAKSILGHLKGSSLDVTICGWNMVRLRGLSTMFSTKFVSMSELDVKKFDSVITAVSSPKPILTVRGEDKPRLVIDMGNPRNVERSDSVCRYISMVELEDYVRKNIRIRRDEVKKAELIIERHLSTVIKKLNAQEMMELPKSMTN